MSWTTIEGEELARLKRRMNETGWQTNCLTAARALVPFYANGSLLFLQGEAGTACAVEGRDGALFPLDGSSAQIYEGNEAAGLRLDIDNVIDYAIFFCGFLRVADGDVFRIIVERGDWGLDTGLMPSDLTPRAKAAIDGSGTFEITAHVVHRNELFRALFRVESDGAMMMLDDEPLGRIVGLH